MKRPRTLHIAIAIVFAILSVGCQQQRDRNGILSERAMVDVLYDYQLALALAAEDTDEGKLAETEYRYTQAVFRKHQITDQEFQLSIAHYARDPRMMLDITKSVTKRFEEQGEQYAQNVATEEGAKHDTVVLYRRMGGVVLTANGHNRHSVSINVPKNINSDHLLVSYRARWIYREGVKAGTLIITTEYDNDSTARRVEPVREYGLSQGVSLLVPQGRRITTVKLDFIQGARWAKFQQVLSLDNIALRAIVAKKS